MNEFWFSTGLLTVLAIGAVVLAAVAARGWDIVVRRFKRHRGVVAMIFLGVAVIAGGKHGAPKVEYPRGISDDGSCFDTNEWSWVEFRWKLSAGYPAATPLEIEAALGGGATTNYAKIADALAGDRTNRVLAASFASDSVTNYLYRIKSDYVPGVVEITDLFAAARREVREVVCTWSCPTNLVGLVGIVQAQRNIPGAPWTDKQTVVLDRTNAVTVTGNYISRGIDWNFRVRVPGFEPITLTNITRVQTARPGGDK